MSKKIDMKAVKKVQCVLHKGVPIQDSRGVKAKKVWVSSYNSSTFILLEKGRWSGTHYRDDLSQHGGIVDGYSTLALTAVDWLCTAKLITKREAKEFDKWWYEQDRKRCEKRELKELNDLAYKHRYALIKRK